MLKRTETRFGIKPAFLTADSAYGSADSLAWLVKRKGIAPHIPVFDKSNRTDGTFPARTLPSIPKGTDIRARRAKSFSNSDALTQPHEAASRPRAQDFYRASKLDCDVCELKPHCCTNAVVRKIPRDLREDARDVTRALASTPEYETACRRRKKVEMLFAHLKRILRLTRLRLRGPNGAKDEFLLPPPPKT